MAAPRPNFLDLRSQSQTSVSRPLKSPRLHVAGDVPPELSPLDAFAMQSRLLAKQLEESTKGDKRVSRLPPLTISSPLVVQARSDYFRSLSHDSYSGDEHGESPNRNPPLSSPNSQPLTPTNFSTRTPEVEVPLVRPQSMHPRMSHIPPTPNDDEPLPPPVPAYATERLRRLSAIDSEDEPSMYGARRERSPSPLVDDIFTVSRRREGNDSPEKVIGKTSLDLSSGGLAPPRSMFPKRSSSIMSSPLDPTDEDSQSIMASSFHSLGAPRKLSNSSGMVSPGFGSFQRTSSFSSDMSAPLPRPSFNFSRPLSRVGTPGLESPARQASSDSHTSYSQSSLLLTDDAANTPVSMHSEGFPDPSSAAATPSAAGNDSSSYIYSKYALPRGKMLQRNGPQSPDAQAASSSQWEQPMLQPSIGGQAPPSPPTRPSSSSGASFARPSMERTKLSTEIIAPDSQPSPNPSRPSTDGSRSFEETRGRSFVPNPQEPASRGRTPMSISTTHTGATSDSASTIRPPRSINTIATATEIPADEHVDKGVALHEAGKLNESTYHLRHAARQGHPTGMLLYALACRHGWGMRANPREGAEWLRKAADCASIEIADDEAQIKEGKDVNVVERKARKAQFALSIYELGVSYMNGWGIDQDKALALRCFEIAGSWGDVDALAEAGFCYAQGVGCKKNLKTSAKFYRQAEAKGMSMPGNSWIHKSKYNDDKEKVKSPKFPGGKDKDDKTRSKSRGRNIFGIKH
ncbi:cell cycle inhibitor protein [Ophiostoma piceae UAMH 11346]|uniref:Cell cycle inhibitor protein n=1 Tax=Ophiostoma piceae (strain UAMH 11346) TaxID=1262450 RepID=S3BU21_OPHP1|nr:cell cycle inhibitor protein [Ophiostoma piceae UAMH 11346]